MNIYEDLLHKRKKLAVVGLGYVGLPLALAFAKKLSVVGFDIDEERLEQMRRKTDPSKELPSEAFLESDILFTSQVADLQSVGFFIITVPTPIDQHNVPDLTTLLKATATIGSVLQKESYVVFESTVYPGCTEEDCLPVLEQESGLKAITDFKIGYSPERINPGDAAHGLQQVVKVVSGCDVESTDIIAKVYEWVVQAGVFKAASIKVAEAAKIIENTQRDVNIALMNELSIIFDKVGINTYEVLEAASTKWNFQKFYPGLVGGHCIGVNPYYLTYKAAELGYAAKMILSGRAINDGMAAFVAKKILQYIIQHNGNVKDSRVLVMGITFKENVSDIRNSKVCDVVTELQSYAINVEVTDPLASSTELQKRYGFGLTATLSNAYDAVIVAVAHTAYKELDDAYFASITKPHGLIADLKGTYRNKLTSRKYWSL
jgi:UDP-N-acetyl-D-glucosamine/UDP-N-acetyl-D-galactosamine dehydrogenase